MLTETGYVSTGDYAVDGTHKVFLVNGAPAIKYTAWSYSYELDGAALGAVTEFDVLTALKADANATKAKAAIKWLAMYIGEGDYADVYDFTEYKAYAAGFNGKKLYMTDRAIDEVATAKTTEVKGAAVTTEKTPAVEAKAYSPYTIAKLLVAEQEKIDAAKEEAVAAIKAAALALRTAGNADAITAACDLYDAIEDGSYLNEKLYEDDAIDAYLGVSLTAVKVVVFEKTAKEAEVSVAVKDLLADAAVALKAVKALDAADTSAVATAYGKVTADEAALKENADLIALFDLYIANAKAEYDAAVAGNAVSAYLVSNATVTAAKDKYTALDQIRNLFLNKTVFDDANATGNYFTVVAGNEASTKTNIKAVIDEFAPATSTEVTAAMKADLDTALAKLALGTKDAKNLLSAALKSALLSRPTPKHLRTHSTHSKAMPLSKLLTLLLTRLISRLLLVRLLLSLPTTRLTILTSVTPLHLAKRSSPLQILSPKFTERECSPATTMSLALNARRQLRCHRRYP